MKFYDREPEMGKLREIERRSHDVAEMFIESGEFVPCSSVLTTIVKGFGQ